MERQKNGSQKFDEYNGGPRPEFGGFTMLPHYVFDHLLPAMSSMISRIVYLFLLRHTIGFQRIQAKASYSFIVKGTGVSRASAQVAIKTLNQIGLVKSRPCKSGTFHSIIGLEKTPEGIWKIKVPVPNNGIPSIDIPNNNTVDTSDKYTCVPVVSNKKEINKNETNTLRQLKNYDQGGLMNEGELQAFHLLQNKYSLEEIDLALADLKQRGTLGKGENVYAPLCYLKGFIQQVLLRARTDDKSNEPDLAEMIWGGISKFGRFGYQELLKALPISTADIIKKYGGWGKLCDSRDDQRIQIIASLRALHRESIIKNSGHGKNGSGGDSSPNNGSGTSKSKCNFDGIGGVEMTFERRD